jgi:hypothetical protein
MVKSIKRDILDALLKINFIFKYIESKLDIIINKVKKLKANILSLYKALFNEPINETSYNKKTSFNNKSYNNKLFINKLSYNKPFNETFY